MKYPAQQRKIKYFSISLWFVSHFVKVSGYGFLINLNGGYCQLAIANRQLLILLHHIIIAF